ncbi:MAG: glycosyltransferase family 39 protein [Christensenellaceae bacterium]
MNLIFGGNTVDRKKKILLTIALYAGILSVTYVLFSVFKPLYGAIRNGAFAQFVSAMFLAFGIFYSAYLSLKKKMTPYKAVAILFFVAIGVRIGYMLLTPASVRQYDTYTRYSNGHEAYAWKIFSDFKLPDTNDYQFYHPPLNAFLQAVFMRITHVLSLIFVKAFNFGDAFYLKYCDAGFPSYLADQSQRYYLYSTCQILSVFYSVLTMVVGYKILKSVGLKGYNLVVCFAFFAFFPRHIVFSATLNNDPLSYLLSLSAIYFTIRWWKDKKLGNILLIALSVGFGMMTKLSSATICLPIAVVFLIEFIKTVKRNPGAMRINDMVVQYASFLVVAVPLGLWFQIYAYVRFDQPFGYVFPYLNGALSTKFASLFGRFVFTLNIEEYFGSLYVRCFYDEVTGVLNNYNVWNVLVRSAIFGEFGYWQAEGFALASIVLELLFVYFAFIGLLLAVIYYFSDRKDKKSILVCDDLNSKTVTVVAFLLVSQIVPYLLFYLKMPYTCTLDFRYVMPVILAFAIMIGKIDEKFSKKGAGLKKISHSIQVLAMTFVGFSTLFYMNCV